MKAKVIMCQALLAAAWGAHDAPHMHGKELDNAAPSPVPTVAGRSVYMQQRRDIFDSLLNILHPGRQGEASESDNANSGNEDNEDNSDSPGNSSGGNNDSSDGGNDHSSSGGGDNPSRSSSDNPPDDSTSPPEPSSSSREEPSSSRSRESSSSERSSSPEPTSSETDSETPSSSESPSPTSDSESSSKSMEVVTVTRPGATKTTMVGPAPTIDQVNGDKADVGASGNQTSIIVATVVTAVALLLCTVLYYLYRRRRKLLEHREDDFFTKSAPSPPRGDNTISTTSPFIPPGQLAGDGYMPDGAYAAGAMPMSRHTDETFRSQASANDSTHLLAHQQQQQQQPMRQNSPPFAQPVGRFHQQMTQASAPPMAQAPASQPPLVPGAAPNRFTTQPMFNPRANPAHSTAPPAQQQYAIPRPPILQQQQQHSVFSPQMHASNHGAGYMN